MKTIILDYKAGLQDFAKYGQDLFEVLQKANTVIVHDNLQPDFSNVPELFDADEKLVLFNQFALDAGFEALTKKLSECKNVQYVLSPYSSYAGLDLELVKSLGIKYRNNGGANAKSVAQYALTAMLQLLHKFPVFAQQKTISNGSILGEEFSTKTVGIIGMGNVGQELAMMLQGLGMKVCYYNRSAKTVKAQSVSFEEVMQQDIVCITVATNAESTELLKPLPSMLQPRQYLIDVSAIDTLYDKYAVVMLVNQDKLSGFAFETNDVQQFTPEPLKNVLITPHMAWCTRDAEERTVCNHLQRAIDIVEGRAGEVDWVV